MRYTILVLAVVALAFDTAKAQNADSKIENGNIEIAITEQHKDVIPKGTTVVAVSRMYRNGEPYTFVRYRDFDSYDAGTVVLNPSGKSIPIKSVPTFTAPQFGPELERLMDEPRSELNTQPQKTVTASIVWLDDDYPPATEEAYELSTEADDTTVRYFIDGLEVDESEISKRNELRAQTISKHMEMRSQKKELEIEEFLQQSAINRNQIVDAASSIENLVIRLNRSQLENIRTNPKYRRLSIELDKRPVAAIDGDMQWTEIWSHARFGDHMGFDIGLWQTEPDCGPIGAFPNYTSPGPLQSGSYNSNHAEYMARIINNVSPSVKIQCVTGTTLPTFNQIITAVPKIEVVNLSGATEGILNFYTNLDKEWDNFVYSYGTIATVAAGNKGNIGYPVGAPGRAANVITVGNVNQNQNPDTIYHTSSYKNSNIGNEKPELSAPGTSTDIPEIDAVYELPGTSQATAHTAGFIADLMDSDHSLEFRPSLTKAMMLAGATKIVEGGETKAGVGGIDYRNTSQHYKNFYFNEAYGSWNQYDALDNGGFDGVVERTYWLNSNKPNVRVALSWINAGTYIKANGQLGYHYDIEVYGPNGAYVGGSHNPLNAYESFDFTVNTSGNYKFVIFLVAENDTAHGFRIGMSINFDD